MLQQVNDAPLDLSYLRDMVGDSPEFMIEMIDLFKSQTPIYIADLENAINNRDWPAASSCAHKIKPTFAYIGRTDAKEHMQGMENDARNLLNLDKLPEALEQIKTALQHIYQQLDLAKAEILKQI